MLIFFAHAIHKLKYVDAFSGKNSILTQPAIRPIFLNPVTFNMHLIYSNIIMNKHTLVGEKGIQIHKDELYFNFLCYVIGKSLFA